MIDLRALAENLAPTAAGITAVLGANTEAGKRMLSPIADEVGKSLAIFGEIFRFYQTENLGKIFTKWAAYRNDRPISPEDFRKAIPLMQPASMQSDDELQARWAALLESTISSDEGTLPSFAQTLSQLSPEEARFLDRLHVAIISPSRYPP